jgi:hypothetical protein
VPILEEQIETYVRHRVEDGREVRAVPDDGMVEAMTVVAAAEAQILGADSGFRLRFGEEAKADGAWAGRRLLFVDDHPAFELSFWCGTCPFLFERLEGSNATLSQADLESRLTAGLTDLDDGVIERIATLLPQAPYLPLLLELRPRLIRPLADGDYFAHEEVSTWGVDPFWDLPQNPRTPYYRTFETTVDRNAHFFEFVVPMVPPAWNDRARVGSYAPLLAKSALPTAVAVSILDIAQPADDVGDRDYFAHWCLTHFLLDGHHKFEAAASAGRSLRLLSLLAVDASLATADQVMMVPALRAQEQASRNRSPS